MRRTISSNYHKLLDFSLGRITFRQVMSELKISSDEELFLMMCGAGLAMPTLPDEDTNKMSNIMEGILVRVGK